MKWHNSVLHKGVSRLQRGRWEVLLWAISDHNRVFSYVGYLEVLSQDLKQKMKEVKSNFHKVFTSHWRGSLYVEDE